MFRFYVSSRTSDPILKREDNRPRDECRKTVRAVNKCATRHRSIVARKSVPKTFHRVSRNIFSTIICRDRENRKFSGRQQHVLRIRKTRSKSFFRERRRKSSLGRCRRCRTFPERTNYNARFSGIARTRGFPSGPYVHTPVVLVVSSKTRPRHNDVNDENTVSPVPIVFEYNFTRTILYTIVRDERLSTRNEQGLTVRSETAVRTNHRSDEIYI